MTATKRVGSDFTKGPILQLMFAFAMPMILSGLLQQLYSMIDLIVVGQFVGSIGTVGVSTGGEAADILLPIASAIAVGGQVYVSQLIGAQKKEKTHTAIGSLLTLMLGFSLVAMVFILVAHPAILKWLNCPEEAYNQARDYMVITAFGTPFVYLYNAIGGILRGFGESKRPLLFVTIASVVNLVMNVALVVVFRLESAGVAIATVFSQGASCIASIVYLLKHKEIFGFELKLSYFKIDREAITVMLKIGIPQAIRSFLVRFSGMWIRAQINSYGLVYSAANSVGNKIEKFIEIFSNSVSHAGASMIGQNLGARNHDRAKKIVRYATLSSVVVAIFFIILGLTIPEQLFGLFTKDTVVMDMGRTFMRIMVFQILLSGIINGYQAMVIGSGNANLNLVIGIIDGIVCKVGLGLIFVYLCHMGAEGYWWGITFSRFIPTLICLAYFKSEKWKNADLTKVGRGRHG